MTPRSSEPDGPQKGTTEMAAGRSGSRTPSPRPSPPTFDAEPSGRFAHEVLDGSGVRGALIGRLAVWAHVPDPSEHAFTKDLDVAVAREDLPKVHAWLAERGEPMRPLSIGGVNVHKPEAGVNVDFIDRSSAQWGDLGSLYSEAVEAAEESGALAEVGGGPLPLVPAVYLVAMKLATAEDKDETDAIRVMEHAFVDVEELRRVVGAHLGPGGTARLEVFLRDIGHPAARARRRYKGYAPGGG